MPEIIQLPPSVINKIAAGEVIERPASVVKELLENAVDAGASRVDVSVVQGGSELVRVADDGCGMTPAQLPLAVASHATSKIRSADDLFRVGTLGFRGEALPSIAEVSQMTVRSRTATSDAGSELEVIGGVAGEAVPCGCPVGTTVEVRNLFYNTPVRRKFLRTTQTEMGHGTEAFTRVALAYERVHFTLKHGDRQLFDLPPTESWRERIATFFGDELADGLMHVESSDGPIQLTGYVANPTHSRANNRMQYLFLNGRHIRDRALQHALGEAYRGLLMTGRYPIAFLRMTIPAEMVDVNVHPTKLEVRFQEGGRIYSQLLGTLRTRFLTTDMTARFDAAHGQAEEDEAASAHDQQRAEQVQNDLVRWAKGQLAEATVGTGDEPAAEPFRQESIELDFGDAEAARLSMTRLDRSWQAAGGQGASRAEPAGDAQPATPDPATPVSALQIHNRYLITESEEGVVVIDQHALHERILYEQLREKVLSNKMETQQLLVPEPVHLAPAEAAAAIEAKDLLAQLGIAVEPFGGDTVLVSSYPAMLANIAPEEMLRQMVDHLLSGGKSPDRRDLLDELLHMISCKAAIKAGDRLAPEEIDALIQARSLVQDSHHCPHGRPTALVFTREELDRRFKRT